MRVIAGRLGGRTFESPRGHRTHPMSDKIRGALFNMLGDVHGLTLLDGFAGSGALGFEALSRGALSVQMLEVDPSAAQTIKKNIRDLGLDSAAQVVRQNVLSWSRNHSDWQFDIVLADPPFDDLQPKILEQLVYNLKPTGLLVVSWPGKAEPPTLDKLRLIAHKSYGDAALYFYQR